ncbi:MAG: type II toxin-antitoxin system RelE/ParE family toxin [Clostridia bacterium]|nr:type II toxin-antitoxin system RelE/ParE family toxin [Clostridia bacterium]
MYKIRFYRKRNGEEPVAVFLKKLASQKGKDSRIQLGKIRDYIKILEEHGTRIGEPFVKKVDDKEDIWELRPLGNRIFFVAWIENTFVLLHVFQKQTQKTPQRQIDQARREVKDLKERGMENE